MQEENYVGQLEEIGGELLRSLPGFISGQFTSRHLFRLGGNDSSLFSANIVRETQADHLFLKGTTRFVFY
jgi:hypothetical protein